jgi:membrane peptidoglycan carboxypeptidase
MELRTSYLQAHLLAGVARQLTFRVEAGPNPSIRFPQQGPYDRRMGYNQLSTFVDKLGAHGYQVEAQAHISPRLRKFTELGVYPIYREKTQGGIKILDHDSHVLFAARYPERVYTRFESIPPLVVKTLLFIENRALLDPGYPSRNPAVEWDRLAKAALDKGLNVLYREHKFAGGSTLATQLEKYRHSPDGRTPTVHEKLRQMVSASLRAYLNGQDTTETRRQVILDYLNSVPLAALPGYGEVSGIGDGLRAWYGTDFEAVNRLLCDGCDSKPMERAVAYKQVLSLFLAQRRPSFYLIINQDALESLTNSYLRVLAKAGVITPELRDVALSVRLKFHESNPVLPPVSFVERKAANAIRRHLSALLEVLQLYQLDRLDLTVQSTLDGTIQEEVTKVLLKLKDPAYAGAVGLRGVHLLDRGDPGRVIYSFTLYEHADGGNLVRVQTDNFDKPFDINEGAKLELGSTAKLRTLATYFEIVAALHDRYAGLPHEKLASVEMARSDRLTRWALDYLSRTQDSSVPAMLEAAMERRYSASPAERFFTGGGLHTFHNFDREDDSKFASVREGFRDSINLVFIRLMRDIVHRYMYQGPGSTAKILEDVNNPARQVYLERFADREGRVFLGRFYRKYRGKKPEEALALLLQGTRLTPERVATVFRSVEPDAGMEDCASFLKSRMPSSTFSDATIRRLYERYSPANYDLPDRGYIARIHPLELWLVAYLRRHPRATLSEVFEASASERQKVYSWLFKTHRKNTQDSRILALLEVEAFLEIHRAWKRLGYSFDSLVPSYATAIGSSADRPSALAELVGIIVNDGIRYPTVRVERLRFAEGTPYETLMGREGSVGQRVLPHEVAAVLRRALIDVAERGTARRIRGVFLGADGGDIVVGGKTGTGDNRHDAFGPKGVLIESRILNRAAVFVFLIGDRFFGTMTAYVPGREAANYGFTSALPVQTLKVLAPKLLPLIDRAHRSSGLASKNKPVSETRSLKKRRELIS